MVIKFVLASVVDGICARN